MKLISIDTLSCQLQKNEPYVLLMHVSLQHDVEPKRVPYVKLNGERILMNSHVNRILNDFTYFILHRDSCEVIYARNKRNRG
jgi:hypothetical protein